jgi:hypothetical protein
VEQAIIAGERGLAVLAAADKAGNAMRVGIAEEGALTSPGFEGGAHL